MILFVIAFVASAFAAYNFNTLEWVETREGYLSFLGNAAPEEFSNLRKKANLASTLGAIASLIALGFMVAGLMTAIGGS